MSLKTATDSAAHLVTSTTEHQVAKATIYTLAWNNHSPGRNRFSDHFETSPVTQCLPQCCEQAGALPGISENRSGAVSSRELTAWPLVPDSSRGQLQSSTLSHREAREGQAICGQRWALVTPLNVSHKPQKGGPDSKPMQKQTPAGPKATGIFSSQGIWAFQ